MAQLLFGDWRVGIKRHLACLMLALGLTACSGPGIAPGLKQAPPAEVFPTSSSTQTLEEYRIGPLDELSITVFQETDLSLEKVPVDASGNILFPLIGLVEASGKTSRELSALIAEKLASRYLVDPQVLVNISKSSSQVVTVEGQVVKPGRYEISGQMTLLSAIASAEGPAPTARLDEVLVFRTIGSERFGARFDLRAIRDGRADDPIIRGNDIVVIGASRAKAIYRDVLTALPGLGSIFIALQQSTK
jgi:polysaccharide biosynthesis/export protein